MKKRFACLFGLTAAAFALFALLLFLPKHNPQHHKLKVEKGQGIAAVSHRLAQQNLIYSRYVLVAGAYLLGIENRLRNGNYRLPEHLSAWDILQHLKQGRPDTVTIRFIEGTRFEQMRRLIDESNELSHDTRGWPVEKLLAAIGAQPGSTNPEGLFAPDSYEIESGASDLQIYRLAYQKQQQHLQTAWLSRENGLPYPTPYQLLIIASIIEKETGHPNDRAHISAVFANRLKIGMRLQSDPTVIYGLGEDYTGRLSKKNLRHDTPYNTYTRAGLPPGPICLPGRDALNAASRPSSAKYLYFVSKMDNSGLSQFSHTLSEHNAAVRQYILKR